MLAVTVTAIEAFDDEYDTLGEAVEASNATTATVTDAQSPPATDTDESA